MCTLSLYFKVFAEAPLLLLANRDESTGRLWDPPAMLSKTPRIFGPRDLAAGGTWLGVNEYGVVAALTNHEGTLASGSSLCSRGFVVMEALRHESARAAKRLVENLSPACKSFTLLIADAGEAFVLDHAGGSGSQTYALLAGPHVVTNARFRDEDDVKAKRLRKRLERLGGDGPPDTESMSSFLGSHDIAPGQSTPLCIHPRPSFGFGTTSSAIVKIGPDRAVREFLFAPGPPCETPFIDVTPGFGSIE